MKMVPVHPSFLDYLFFLTFLFFVAIILMNLLVGLAFSDVTEIILPFITCSFSPKDAARRILIFNQNNDAQMNESFTIKPNERVCLGYLAVSN